MLVLPKGVWIWYLRQAELKNKTLGALLIENACEWAKENGFTCDHPQPARVKYDSKKLDLLRRKVYLDSLKELSTPTISKCIMCGQFFLMDKNGTVYKLQTFGLEKV
jgi:hypothetical protein